MANEEIISIKFWQFGQHNFKSRNIAFALFLVRLVVGSVGLLHGMQKVFGSFGGSGLDGWVQWTATMGVPGWLAYTAAFFELIGGILVLLGLYTEIGALMLSTIFIGAIWLVHGGKGYFTQNGGYEYPLNLLILCIALIISGPGMWYLQDSSLSQR